MPEGYEPRRPESTVRYGLVREHLSEFLEHASDTYGRGLPRHVVGELEDYLRCGIFAHGFIRCHCDACGHDLLVAFSCKGRGACPSCGARRMCNEAAHLVDRVLPSAPVRQWVLSLPFELRRLAAFSADVLSALGRAFVEAIFTEQRKAVGKPAAETGAITFVQRFGGSMNLNVHFHVVVIDGVFTFDPDGRARFHESPRPTEEPIERVARRTYDRTLRWLRKRGHLDERDVEERSTEPAMQTAIDACAAVALRGGTFEHRGADRAIGSISPSSDETRFERRKGPLTAERDGFNVQAAVRISADDDEGRERLLRYCARPAFAHERLELLADGRVGYRLKIPTRRATHRVMTPVELLARIAALVPPPRYPLVRYHGVLAPHSKRRAAVVPRR